MIEEGAAQQGRDGLPALRPVLLLRHALPAGHDAAEGVHPERGGRDGAGPCRRELTHVSTHHHRSGQSGAGRRQRRPGRGPRAARAAGGEPGALRSSSCGPGGCVWSRRWWATTGRFVIDAMSHGRDRRPGTVRRLALSDLGRRPTTTCVTTRRCRPPWRCGGAWASRCPETSAIWGIEARTPRSSARS